MRDDVRQFAMVSTLFGSLDTWIPTTVVLETEWVLRRLYRLPTAEVLTALRSLLGLPGVAFESRAQVSRAIVWCEGGMDFADALHLATARDCTGLATFDGDFIKSAARLSAGNVTEP